MPYHLPPTSVLPALATLHTCDAARVGEALWVLQVLYFPHALPQAPMCNIPVLKQCLSNAARVSRPRQMPYLVQHGIPDSGYASAEEDEEITDEDDIEAEEEEALDLLRSDELERGYSIKWLIGLVKRGDEWVCGTLDAPTSEEQDLRAAHLEDASRLLARFAGDDIPEEALIRKFVFPFRMPSNHGQGSLAVPPITVELNDAPVDGTDHTAVGLQSWGSAIVLAERMCFDPERYLGALDSCACLSPIAKDAKTKSTEPRIRLLELGSGTGLLSITAAQILSRISVQGDITATDHHPSVLQNLACNVSRNPSATNVSVEKLDWAEDGCVGGYDIVLGADVVYRPEHASWIKGCVGRTLKKGGVFWLIIPVRAIGRHERLGETVEAVFPVAERENGEGRLVIVSREDIGRVEGVGRADEGGYTLFEIRWL